MALLAPTNIIAVGTVTPVENTLTASDTLTFKSGSKQWLYVRNATGGALTINLLGDLAADAKCSGLGEPASIAGGYDFVVPDGEERTLHLSSISQYLQDSNNTPAVTAGTGAIAFLYEA